MNIIQCKICKKPFQSLSTQICNECHEQLDRDYITVRDYIYDNSGVPIDKVSEETGVPRAIILQLIKEGRLKPDTPDLTSGVVCEVCRKPISSGRLCRECKEKISATMDKTLERYKPPEQDKKDIKASKHTAKMHTSVTKTR